MKRSFFILCLSYLCMTSAIAADFPMHAGCNISGWLSQANRTETARKAWFTQQELHNLKAMGFDHIRLPVAENQMFTAEGSDSIATFKLVFDCLKWCQAEGMACIFDYHSLNDDTKATLWTSTATQNRFVNQWRQIADLLKGYPNDLVAFELLNEPVAPQSSQWNSLAARVIAAIRETQPERKLIVGSNKWNAVNQFSSLEVPRNDSNIILNFHFYVPMPLTHYGAEWDAVGQITAPLHYPGELITNSDYNALPTGQQAIINPYRGYYDVTKLRSMIMQAVLRAKALGGLQLYCGEFGAYKCDRTAKLTWLTDVVSILNGYGIAHSHWEYKQGFGFCDQWGNLTDSDVRDIIVQKGELYPPVTDEVVDAPFVDTFEDLQSEWQSQDANNVTCSVVANPLLNDSNTSNYVLQINKAGVSWPAVQRAFTPSAEVSANDSAFHYLRIRLLNPSGISMRIKLYDMNSKEYWYEYSPTKVTDNWQSLVLDVSGAKASSGDIVSTHINKIAIRPNAAGTIYIDNVYLSIASGATTNIRHIVLRSQTLSAASSAIYDLSGRQMTGNYNTLAPGIYIQNGRKFILK